MSSSIAWYMLKFKVSVNRKGELQKYSERREKVIGMQYKAHPYQEIAEQYALDHPRCGLFLDMGL